MSESANMEITRASEERLAVLSALLGRAFVVEPMVRWSVGDHGDAAARFVRYFECFSEWLVRRGMLWEAGPARGAAIWIPADASEAYSEAIEVSRERVHALTDDGGPRYDAFWDWVEARVPDEPVWHLDSLAVDARWRGQGIGAALIELGLRLARENDAAAFLETGNPRNVAYYERFGFRTVDDADSPDGGPHVWFMRCDTAAPQATKR